MWNHIKIIRIIKSKLPFEFKIILIRILFMIQNVVYNLFPEKIAENTENKKRIYFLLSTDYANLGDHAMSYASLKFFEKYFNNYEVIEITVNDTLKTFKSLKNMIRKKDIVCLKGGGNIGIEYFREELIRRKIISSLDNRIIVFPQTVYFPNTKLGKKEFDNTKRIYNKNSELRIFLRDNFSYEYCINELNNIQLVPDIVFSLEKKEIKNKEFEKNTRFVPSICMRTDVEGVYQNSFKNELINNLKRNYGDVRVFDTIKPYYISINNRNEELHKLMNDIKKSSVLITDRLHGMILAYLLEVPCIVLKTYNYKLTGQYKWLANCNYIQRVTGNIDEIIEKVDLYKSNNLYNTINFTSYFEKIKKAMEEN